MPCGADRKIKRAKLLKVHTLAEEEWRQRDSVLSDKFGDAKESPSTATRQKSADNFYDKAERLLNDTQETDRVQV